jgi:hypothetical protein
MARHHLGELALNEFTKMATVKPMKTPMLLRITSLLAAATLCPLLPVFSGCDTTESTNTEKADCTLNPSAQFAVVQDPPADPAVATTTTVTPGATTTTVTIEGGVTNTVITVEPATTNIVPSGTDSVSITSLLVTATPSGDSAWTVLAEDNIGNAYAGSASGPAINEPGSENAYAPGATVATFALQCAGLSGEITAVALTAIPLEVMRTTTTNGSAVVVGRHGQHTLTPGNTELRPVATVDGEEPYTLTGRAPCSAATIVW